MIIPDLVFPVPRISLRSTVKGLLRIYSGHSGFLAGWFFKPKDPCQSIASPRYSNFSKLPRHLARTHNHDSCLGSPLPLSYFFRALFHNIGWDSGQLTDTSGQCSMPKCPGARCRVKKRGFWKPPLAVSPTLGLGRDIRHSLLKLAHIPVSPQRLDYCEKKCSAASYLGT